MENVHADLNFPISRSAEDSRGQVILLPGERLSQGLNLSPKRQRTIDNDSLKLIHNIQHIIQDTDSSNSNNPICNNEVDKFMLQLQDLKKMLNKFPKNYYKSKIKYYLDRIEKLLVRNPCKEKKKSIKSQKNRKSSLDSPSLDSKSQPSQEAPMFSNYSVDSDTKKFQFQNTIIELNNNEDVNQNDASPMKKIKLSNPKIFEEHENKAAKKANTVCRRRSLHQICNVNQNDASPIKEIKLSNPKMFEEHENKAAKKDNTVRRSLRQISNPNTINYNEAALSVIYVDKDNEVHIEKKRKTTSTGNRKESTSDQDNKANLFLGSAERRQLYCPRRHLEWLEKTFQQELENDKFMASQLKL